MADIKLDVFNKVCPMPAALTRKAVQKMAPGQTIEIEGDFCPAIENVIHMLKKNNAEILEITDVCSHSVDRTIGGRGIAEDVHFG